MTKLEKVRDLCNRRNVKITNLEKELGFSKGSLSKLDTTKPSAERLTKIARYFEVPVYYFDDDIQDMNDLMDRQRRDIYDVIFKDDNELFELYRSGHTDEVIDRYLEKMPVFDVSAGQGRVNGQYATEYMTDDTEDGYSWCTVCGDSMLPELKDGDRIKVHLQTETTPHDLTVVKIDGESCTVKFVEITDTGVWLKALNKEVYEDTFYTIKDVMQLPIKIIGKVTEVRREY